MRTLLVVLLSLVVSQFAVADISEDKIIAYNAAVESGADAQEILKASQDLIAEALANPDDTNALLLAYESGVRLCQIGSCKEAQGAAEFVLRADLAENLDYPSEAERKLLSALVGWHVSQTRKTRKELDETLTTLISVEPSILTVNAFEARYQKDIQGGNQRRASKSAKDAVSHMQPIADIIPQSYVNAAFAAAISAFNDDQDVDAMRDMTHLRGWLFQYYATAEGPIKEWSEKLGNHAHAWGLAMGAWYTSTGNRGLSEQEIDEILATYKTDERAAETDDTDDSDALPFCTGRLNMKPRLRYKSGQVQRGFFGAIIAKFDIEDGKVVNAVITASVPEERFEAQALETISKWVWQPDENQVPNNNCRLSGTNIILPMVFALD